MAVRAPKLLQGRGEIRRLGDDIGRSEQRLEVEARQPTVVNRLEEIAHVKDADDVVERLPEDGITRVRRVEDDGERLLGRHVHRNRCDVGLRHHHIGDVLVPEDEDLVDHHPLVLLDLALLGGARDEHAQLGLGVHLTLGARRLEPERVENRVGRLLQQPDRRAEDRDERTHRDRHPACDRDRKWRTRSPV